MEIPKELKEVAPLWYNHLTSKNGKIFEFFKRDGIVFDLENSERCVVGEAYGFNDIYNDPDAIKYCHNCTQYSVDIYNHHENDIATPIKKFVKHFKEVHRRNE